MFDQEDQIFTNLEKAGYEFSSPGTLFSICMDVIVSDLSIICDGCDYSYDFPYLKNDIILPSEICERLFHSIQNKLEMTDKYANVFKDKAKGRLKSISLEKSKINDRGLSILAKHNLEKIRLSSCDDLSIQSLEEVSCHSDNLISLEIENCKSFFREWVYDWQQAGYPLRAPALRKLVLQRQPFPNLQLKNLTALTHLDFSECLFLANLPHLATLERLKTLILYNVLKLYDVMDWICSLKALSFLDVSQSNDRNGRYSNPNQVLTRIIRSLPLLESLDISGTNLAGNGVAEGGCDVPGLAERIDRPLDFLGLYGTTHAACCRHDIPALRITGHADEDQIMTASIAYMKRPEILTRVLNDLYHLFRYENGKNADVKKSLAIVLEAMERHTTEKHIQISGSATLFYIVKGKEKESITTAIKQRIVVALLTGMEMHMDDDTMMRNGCLTLCQFKIPIDVVFQYKRLVTILLQGVVDSNQEGFVQRIAIFLLNSLACQVDGVQKQFLGDSGAITKMLELIKDRSQRRVCDDVMEVAWSTMWNVTDETPENCRRFLADDGIKHFLDCLEQFPQKEELLRNMMGLLGNVAEVAQLRSVFMTPNLLDVFYDLLESDRDGIEVSYNAAGVLAHLASDGPEAWHVKDPTRESVLERMDITIKRWNLETKRNINYRSFQPILGLLRAYHTPQCQHWALWALANLTTVYPEKYCPLVEAENGRDILSEIIEYPDACEEIKVLAKLVWHNCYY